MSSGSSSAPHAEQPEVHLISGARRSHSADLDRRMKRYLISMGIRTVCVVLAVVVPGPVRWVFIVGAVILPYIAVVMANAVGERREQPLVAHPQRVALPPEAADLGGPKVYIPDAVPRNASSERVIRGSDENTG